MRLNTRPLAVEYPVPGCIPVAALDDEVALLNPLKLETHPQGCPHRAFIEGVAFPFDAPVAEVEGMAQHQVGGFGIGGGALGNRAVPDAPQFDLEVRRDAVHVGRHANRVIRLAWRPT